MAEAIDWQKIWKTFRKGGTVLALTSLTGAIVFGVLNGLTGELVPSIVTLLRDYWSPPKYMMFFKTPVEIDISRTTIEPVPKEDDRRIEIGAVTPRYIPLSGPPGEYWITLTRKDSKFLPMRLPLKRGENIEVETSEEKWATSASVSKSAAEVQPRDTTKGGPVVVKTRWTTTALDYGQISVARSNATKKILFAGLNEVGTSSSDAMGKSRIYNDYWGTLPVLRENNGITIDNPGPWGGAFLTWIVRTADATPPNSAAAYNSWVNWAKSIPASDPEPGAIALFATRAVAGLRGNYLAGIVVRKLPDCTEIITGNIADRVVITCVTLPIEALRRPGD